MHGNLPQQSGAHSMNRITRNTRRRLTPRTTVIGGAALCLISGATGYRAGGSSASPLPRDGLESRKGDGHEGSDADGSTRTPAVKTPAPVVTAVPAPVPVPVKAPVPT